MPVNKEKFEGMDYETAYRKLNEFISILEKADRDFDVLMEIYKEAFEYYTYCSEYLTQAGDKIKELNRQITAIANPLED